MMKVWYSRTEEHVLAPGLIMKITREDDNLHETVSRFLKRKASIGEVRRAVRAGGSPRCFGQGIATATDGGTKNMEEDKE